MHTAESSAVADRFHEERAELERILASKVCARAPNLASLLRYICERYFEGATDDLKEYTIAVEALGRPAEFDQKANPIVRVEAHRLRKRLQQYYEQEGREHAIQIELPPGRYVPRFVRREIPKEKAHPQEQAPSIPVTEERAAQEATPMVVTPPDVAVTAPPPDKPPASPVETKTREHREAAAEQRPGGGRYDLPSFARARWAAYGAMALLLGGALWWWLARIDGGKPGEAAARKEKAAQQELSAPGGMPDSSVVRIAVGSRKAYVDHAGNEWLADAYFSGGAAVSSPNAPISFTRDAELYRHRREGEFRYDIPLPQGAYEMWLHFAETVNGPLNVAGGGETSRLFSVYLNGEPLLLTFDVFADAGGENKADIRVFRDVSPAEDGYLHLEFKNQKSGAILSGIELFPAPASRPRPLRVVAFDHAYRSRRGEEWWADRFFQGGVFVARGTAVTGTSEPGLFNGERFGNFVYEFPVAPGSYTVRLLFSERWFGPNKPGGGGVGSRVFDVYCNGTALLRNFDIFRAAGGADKAVERVFRNLKASAQGKLRLSFVPVVNYAAVNAIEVIPETAGGRGVVRAASGR